MKKILLYTALVLLSVSSCLKFEEPTSLAVQSAGAPTIEVSAVGDSTFTATVTPAAGTNFYAYAVLEGAAKASVSASNLLKVKVGSGIGEGLVNVKDAATKTVVLKGLKPNTDYTVYAAATNEQGQVTEVVTASTHTSDGLVPVLTGISSKDGSTAFTFSENIKLNKDGKAYATYYKLYNPEDDTTIVVPTSKITVKGNVATFPVIDAIPGAYVVYTFEKGLFKDYVDSVAAGFNTNTFEVKSGEVTISKNGSRIPTKAWDLTWTEENKKGDTLVYFADPASLVPVLKNSDRVLSYIDEEADWVVKVRHNYKSTEYLYPVSDYGYLSDTTFAFMLDEAPEYTTTLDFMVAEGVLFDEYGNPNNAFERESAYMRLLASTGIEGVYSYTWNGYSLPLYIEEVDDTTALVYGLDPIWVINADLFGNAAYGPLKAKYDKTKGTLSIAYGQTFAADVNLPMLGIEGWNFSFLGLSEESKLIQKGNFVIDVLDNGCLEASGSFILYELEEDDYLTNPVALKDCLYIKMSNTFEDPTAVASKASPMAKSNYVEVRKF